MTQIAHAGNEAPWIDRFTLAQAHLGRGTDDVRHDTPDHHLAQLWQLDVRVGRIFSLHGDVAFVDDVKALYGVFAVDDGDDDLPGRWGDAAVNDEHRPVGDDGFHRVSGYPPDVGGDAVANEVCGEVEFVGGIVLRR